MPLSLKSLNAKPLKHRAQLSRFTLIENASTAKHKHTGASSTIYINDRLGVYIAFRRQRKKPRYDTMSVMSMARDLFPHVSFFLTLSYF